MARPIDKDLHGRIGAARTEHPDWTITQIANHVGCTRRLVAKVAAPRATASRRGLRLVVPLELVRHAERAHPGLTGAEAVLEVLRLVARRQGG